MIETIRRYEHGLPGAPVARPGKVRAFFDELNERVKGNKRLPRWVGELYYEVHRGTYTSIAKNKRNNRKAEFLYTTAEWISSLNRALFDANYPAEELNSGWRQILLNQFHDVLPGSSIKQVYEDTDEIYRQIFATGKKILSEGLERIASAVNVGQRSLIVFNPNSFPGCGLVEFSYPFGEEAIQLQSADGRLFPCQKIKGEDSRYAAYVIGIPPKGYSTLKIAGLAAEPEKGSSQRRADQLGTNLHVSKERLENRYFKVELDEHGHFTSIIDKRVGREVLKAGERGNVIQAFEDKPRREDNWNLDIYYSEKMWEVDDVESVEVLENGPVSGILRITRKFLSSSIVQDIIIYNDIPRIDFNTTVDWKEKDIVLKVSFPVDINATKATYEIQFGHIERSTHFNTSWDIAQFEVCGHKWADLSEDGYGVSLMNDCKYGYDIKDGHMRLTLLRSGTVPNPAADKEVHHFIYSLYPHIGDWREGGTVAQAYDLNNPLIGKVVERQGGNLPQTLSMISVDRENVVIEAIKKAEDEDATIIRVYEAYNRRTNATIRLYREIKQVTECDLMEKDLPEESRQLKCSGQEFAFTIRPLEIKTFKVVWAD